MRQLWYKLLILWYRITGSSDVQAEWRAQRAMEAPEELKSEVRIEVERAVDERFFCVCGQMLVAGDRTCPACGRRQWLPYSVRKFFRLLRSAIPLENPGMGLTVFLIAIGFVVQLRFAGSLTGGVSSLEALFSLGASFPSLTWGPQPWRAFTYTCLHGGWMHVAFNTIALIQIGPLIERTFGTARFLTAWVLTGILAALLPIWVTGGSLVVGASGSVFGLIGMALIYGHIVGTSQGLLIRNEMIKWVIYATIFGLMIPNVAHGAHFAGLLGGLACGYFLQPPLNYPGRKRLTPWLGTMSLGIMLWALVNAGLWFSGGAQWTDGFQSPGTSEQVIADAGRWARENSTQGELQLDEDYRMSFRGFLRGQAAQAHMQSAQEAFGFSCQVHAMGLSPEAANRFRLRLNEVLSSAFRVPEPRPTRRNGVLTP